MGVLIDSKTYLTDAGFNYEHHRIPLLLKKIAYNLMVNVNIN